MTDEPVDRRAVAVWRWETAAGGALVFSIIAIVVLASRLPLAPAIILLGLLMVLLAWITWWYPAARHRRLGYRVDDVGITIRDGIFWRTQSALARVRIQHTDVYQGPLQRHYGIATLKLYTAGSSYNRIELPGLAHGTAIALRDALQREGTGDAI